MRFQKTPAFNADFRRLSPAERKMFKEAAREFSDACDLYDANPSLGFPGKFRVKSVQNADGVFEMTWSFSGPDGRATWEWAMVDKVEQGPNGEEVTTRHRAVRWRRVGSHVIYKKP